MALEAIVKEIQAPEARSAKADRRDRNRSQAAAKKTCPARCSDTGEWINRGPVLDALYTGNIKLDQIWLPDMKINYNFSSRRPLRPLHQSAIARSTRRRPARRRSRPIRRFRATSASESCSWQRRTKRRNRRRRRRRSEVADADARVGLRHRARTARPGRSERRHGSSRRCPKAWPRRPA